ncbi:bestrophin-like domain [Spirosoma endophyticum]|uniref:DUF4239 domain-containing protein n=1 Tax=Spirosoma endophyticum TaxID=662367 RepID=A0A1I2HI19_9BACT|nr:DUF4239 domain-containing protein [Spirosoma endophyticum]SFF29794.1 Protein of unknown function [Spirosoma endophyticum]
MEWVYTLPNGLFFLLCTGTTIVFAALGLLASRPWVRRHADEHAAQNDLVSYFLGASGVVYGIALGLVAAGVWTNFQTLSGQVDQEAAITAAIYQDVSAYPMPHRLALQSQLRQYVQVVIDQDWPQHRAGKMPAASTRWIYKAAIYQDVSAYPMPQRLALQSQLRQYVQVVIDQDWPQHRAGKMPAASTRCLYHFKRQLFDFMPADAGQRLIHEQALDQYNELAKVRRSRLQGSDTSLPAVMWWVIILGAAINLIVTWFFISDHVGYHLALTILLALLLGSLLFLTAAMDNPFRGGFSVDAEAFKLILPQMPASRILSLK